MTKHSHMRPFANLISLNELVNLVMAHVFTIKRKWMAKDIYEISRALEVFPMSENPTYVYRIMKNLAQKEILLMESTWSTTERPTLYYSVTGKGTIHFYSGEQAVIKTMPTRIRRLRHFLNDLEKKLSESQSTPSPLSEDQNDFIIGVADYYDWLLLRASLDGKSPHTYKDLGEDFGKPVNLSYLYKLHEELEYIGYISGNWITSEGKEKLVNLEVALFAEVLKAKERITRLEKTESLVKGWIKEKGITLNPKTGH
ncbi:hypothetical protein [Brevibacillus brevis]|uniref:hypothetical protein n=1 Tax=Brevibacillus brevis TaxID=1393 RepID=UPI0037C8AEC1